MVFQSIQIIGNELNKFQAKEAEAQIKVHLGDEMDQMAFDKAAEIISAGEKAATEAIPSIISRLKEEGLFV
jgi:hypothetical protein